MLYAKKNEKEQVQEQVQGKEENRTFIYTGYRSLLHAVIMLMFYKKLN